MDINIKQITSSPAGETKKVADAITSSLNECVDMTKIIETSL